MSASSYVHLDVNLVKRVTEKAMLLVFGEDDREEWFPLSQVDDADQIDEGDEDITVSVTRWIVDQKEIEVE